MGEPAPGDPTTPCVALVVIAVVAAAGVAAPEASARAATPATWGEAIEVPLMVLVALSLVFQAEVMPRPGAKMSTQEP